MPGDENLTSTFQRPTQPDGWETATTPIIISKVQGEDYPRAVMRADGSILTGDGSAYPATALTGLSAGGVAGSHLASNFLQVYSADGQDETGDATYTVTGVAAADTVLAVLFLSTKASVATIEVLDPAGFTCTANTITAGTPVDRSNDQLIFFVLNAA